MHRKERKEEAKFIKNVPVTEMSVGSSSDDDVFPDTFNMITQEALVVHGRVPANYPFIWCIPKKNEKNGRLSFKIWQPIIQIGFLLLKYQFDSAKQYSEWVEFSRH